MQIVKNKKVVKIEGFRLEKIISQCAQKDIGLENLVFKGDMECTVTIDAADFPRLKSLARNQYRITVLQERGISPSLKGILNRKSMIFGAAVFLLLFFLQGQFISEIRIDGYVKNTETDIRKELKKIGVYEGAPKTFDANDVKETLYSRLENIAWVGLDMKGNMLEVKVSETSAIQTKIPSYLPCNLVAQKYGIVEKIIAKNGRPAMTAGGVLVPGQIGISGTYKLKDDGDEKKPKEWYVHAEGEIIAKVPYRHSFYLERYDLIKKPTGNKMYGIDLHVGKLRWNTVDIFSNWESWVYKEEPIIDITDPFHFKLSIAKGEEVTLFKKERDRKDLEREANGILRGEMKKKSMENAQILNKSLMFEPKINIIGVSAMMEVRENIAVEEEILIGEPAN